MRTSAQTSALRLQMNFDLGRLSGVFLLLGGAAGAAREEPTATLAVRHDKGV